jgi:subtilisin family serine protease
MELGLGLVSQAWMKYFMVVLVVLKLLMASCLVGISAKEVYVVYAGDHGGLLPEEVADIHHSMLASVKGNADEARESLLYSYKHSFNGFAAHLSPEEASAISEMEEVISVFPSKNRRMHTTRSWDFLGMEGKSTQGGGTIPPPSSLWKEANYGQDTIIGLLDSGIWPEAESFKDDGMPSVPSTWKGICEEGEAFNISHCNKKLIGARYYLKGYDAYYGALNETATPDYRSPRDHDGHGTHTSSTAAGREVDAAALGGFAAGKAAGGAPMARLAMYKVCWPIPGEDPAMENTCTEADMLAALDDAINDGVHVLSISIGTTGMPPVYANDAIAIGSLHAVRQGVFVACSAGNEGPKPATSSNLAPWITTVAANSVDRDFVSPVLLGDDTKVKGQTVTPYKLEDKFYPLVFAADAVLPTVNRDNISAGQCLPGSLDSEKVKGKIVFCLRGNGPRVGKGMEVKRAGGAAVILGNLPMNAAEISVDAYVLAGTAVVSDDAKIILAYINSTTKPMAQIAPANTVLRTTPAPFMAAFSSRGPNLLNPDILKPDITAPGLNILAAWSGAASPTKLLMDDRRVKYNIVSGTSMSCPHIAGVAALLKVIHPYWSPAAIKSALMTTANVTNNEGHPIPDAYGNPATPFIYGSGQMNPNQASDPGLLYDATIKDYALFLCGSGINATTILPNTSFKCPENPPKAYQLNYPSVAIANLNNNETVTRTVTNVGGKSEYIVSIDEPPGVSVDINPKKLSFQSTGEKQIFTIEFTLQKPLNKKYVFGSYTWSDGNHQVRSPIAVSSM